MAMSSGSSSSRCMAATMFGRLVSADCHDARGGSGVPFHSRAPRLRGSLKPPARSVCGAIDRAHGYERNGVRYLPVIRKASTGAGIVTWGEFVELGYLRETGAPGCIPVTKSSPRSREELSPTSGCRSSARRV